MGADRCQKIEEALQAFALDGAVKAYERYGSGHINDTFRVTCEKDGKEIHYILQRMNTEVFKDPVSLMKNIIGVTSFMRKQQLLESISVHRGYCMLRSGRKTRGFL